MTARPQQIAALARDVAEAEAMYLLHGDRHDPVTTPWMPYQPADFIGILWECMTHITRMQKLTVPSRVTGMGTEMWEIPRFLDVGCGPGTKMQIAFTLFGLQADGVEIDKGMAEEASVVMSPAGSVVTHGDALKFDGYENYDLIWLYRPFRDRDKELKLENLIIDRMRPGTILAGGSWDTDIPGLGWEPVVDDTLQDPSGSGACIWRGAWRKPLTTMPTS